MSMCDVMVVTAAAAECCIQVDLPDVGTRRVIVPDGVKVGGKWKSDMGGAAEAGLAFSQAEDTYLSEKVEWLRRGSRHAAIEYGLFVTSDKAGGRKLGEIVSGLASEPGRW